MHLEKAIGAFYAELTPADIARLEDIRGGRFFSPALVQVFRSSIAANPITPAIITDQVSRFLEERARFLQTLENTEKSLKALGVEHEHVDAGSAEVAFLLPRALFANRFTHFVAELSTIDRLIRIFSETATGAPEEAELHEISTSDPTFSVRLSVPSALVIAKTAKWALDTWQTLEDVRKVRAETKRINLLTPEELTATFDSKIQERIETALKSQAQELMTGHARGSHPRQEQAGNLEWALDSVLTRVDRGMVIEIRFLPPPAAPTEAPLEEGHAMAELVQLQSQLVFPRGTHEPARRLPPAEPPHLDAPHGLTQPPSNPSEVSGSASQSTYEGERPLPPAEPPPLHLEAPFEPTPKKPRKTQGSASKSGNGGR